MIRTCLVLKNFPVGGGLSTFQKGCSRSCNGGIKMFRCNCKLDNNDTCQCICPWARLYATILNLLQRSFDKAGYCSFQTGA